MNDPELDLTREYADDWNGLLPLTGREWVAVFCVLAPIVIGVAVLIAKGGKV